MGAVRHCPSSDAPAQLPLTRPACEITDPPSRNTTGRGAEKSSPCSKRDEPCDAARRAGLSALQSNTDLTVHLDACASQLTAWCRACAHSAELAIAGRTSPSPA